MKLFKTILSGKEIYLGEIDEDKNIYCRNIKDSQIIQFIDVEGNQDLGLFVDKDVFEQYIIPRCGLILIKNVESVKVYSCSAKKFMSESILVKDRYIMAVSKWDVADDEPILHEIKVVNTPR